jgi:hypothetical protein
MSQVSVCSTTAKERSSWRALRPVLILGGLVAVWWALMSGVAHADGPHHRTALEQLPAHAKAHHATPVRNLADRAHRTHEQVGPTRARATGRVVHEVRHQARPVTRTVASVVESTRVTSHTVRAVHTTVSGTVARTRMLVRDTAASPGRDVVGQVVDRTAGKPESSTGQGNSHSSRPQGKGSVTSFAQLASTAFDTGGPGSATSTTADRVNPSIDGRSPANGPRGAPAVPGPCASPSGSGSSSSTPEGITGSSWLGLPSVLRDHHAWRLARLPGGPAYRPGSSPD